MATKVRMTRIDGRYAGRIPRPNARTRANMTRRQTRRGCGRLANLVMRRAATVEEAVAIPRSVTGAALGRRGSWLLPVSRREMVFWCQRIPIEPIRTTVSAQHPCHRCGRIMEKGQSRNKMVTRRCQSREWHRAQTLVGKCFVMLATSTASCEPQCRKILFISY
jgi:hypothetical protein